MDEELKKELERLKAVNQTLETQGKQLEALNNLTSEFASYKDATAEQKEQIAKITKDLASGIDSFNAKMTALSNEVEDMRKKRAENEPEKPLSEIIMENAEIQRMKGVGTLDKTTITVGNLHLKATIDGATQTGSGGGKLTIHPERTPGIFGLPFQPLLIRNLIPVRPTGSDTVTFVRVSDIKNDSDGNSGKGGAGYQTTQTGLKPKQRQTYEQISRTVQTIAAWHPVTRSAIADEAELRNIIDSHLLYSVKLKEEYELLYGAGGSSAIEGLIPVADSYDTSRDDVNDTLIDKLRRAMTQVQLNKFPVTGIVLHPEQWEAVELAKNGDKDYLYGSPGGSLGARIWGVPVAASQSIDSDDFLVGNFQVGAVIRDREDAVIRISDSHEDLFVRNMWVVLAEERIATQIYYPSAFVTGTFSAGS